MLNHTQEESSSETAQLLEKISELEEQVSNLKRLEITVERNTELFEALLAANHEGIVLTRVDGTIIRVIHGLLGYRSREICGFSICEFVHPDDRPLIDDALERLRTRDISKADLELRTRAANGHEFCVQTTITDMLDHPAVQALVHNYRDVTALRRQEIAASELAALIPHAPFAMFSKDLKGKIQSWNGGAEAMFGYSAEEIIGQPVAKLIPMHEREGIQRLRQTVIDERKPSKPVRTSCIGKDGTLSEIELVLAPLFTNGHVRGVAHLSRPAS